MIAQSRKHGSIREEAVEVFRCHLQDYQLHLLCLIPNVVRRKVTSPEDIVDLKQWPLQKSVSINPKVI